MNLIKLKYILFSIILIPLTLTASSSGADSFKWNTKTNENKIIITVDIPENYYLYRDFTTVVLNSNNQSIKANILPKSIEHIDEFGTKLFIYPEGSHKWIFSNLKPGDYKANISFQGCSKKPFACYPPKDFSKTIKLNSGEQTKKIESSLIENNNKTENNIFPKEQKNNVKSIEQDVQINTQNSYLGSLIKKGGIWIFIVALLGGLFSVFTPCVLPLLPITIAILGAGQDAKKIQAFKRSFLYVTGIVITFTSLAVFASISGRAFGTALLSNPSILLIFAIFFIVMSLSLLGMYDLQLPNSWNNALNKFGGGTDLGAFFMGLVAGFIAIPCTGPILATLLGISAASGSIVFGGLLLFVYAVGFGIPFFIVGIGLVKAPKSGAYMDIVKSFLGVIILILSIYIISIAIPTVNTFLSTPSNTFKFIALTLIIIGVLFGAFHADGHSVKKRVKYLKITGAVILAFGIVWILKIPVGSSENNLKWNTNLTQAFSIAKENKKPIVLDFTAEWCTACKELESMTFSDKEIKNKLQNNWILAKVDATRDSDRLRTVLKKYNIKGFPTVIFFTPEGKEFARFSGFLPPDKFIKYLQIKGN